MALDSIGYYALPVIPSFEGMDRQVNASMKKSFGGFGKKIGVEFGQQLGAGIKSSASAVTSAAKAHTDALDKVKDATGKLRAEEAKLDAARSNAAGRAQAVGTAERRLKELRATGSATDKQLAIAERDVASARERARNAAAQSTSVEQRVESSRRREAAAAREAKRAEDELAHARRSNTGASMGNPLSGAEQGMRSSSGGLSDMAGGIGGKVGKAFMGALGGIVSVAAVGALFKSALGTGIEFERTVNAFSGVTASGADGMEKMRQAARALGTDTQLAGVSASDAGKAMLELAKGGMTAQQAMDAARGTLQLATAGQLDAAEAASIQSAAINTFSLNASDAMHVADLLAAAANASSADVSDLGMALKQGGAVAAGFGVSIEDTLTALTMFSRMGINGSDAGTMLKTSLQAITDQGNPAQGAIEELGLALYDAQGKFVGVESMMKQVAEASKHMTQEQFQAATNVLFGSDAMRASMVAAEGGAAAWDEAAKAVNRQGAAADMAGAQMQGLPGVVEAMSNAWEGFKLKLFDVLDGPLIAIGKWFLDVLNGEGPAFLGQYGDLFRDTFASIGEAIGPVKDVLGDVGDAIKQYIVPALSQYFDQLKGPLGDAGRQLVATFKEAAPTLKAVAMVIGGVFLGAIKALGVVFPMVIRSFTTVMRAAQLFHQGLQAGVGVVTTVASAIKTVFVGAWDLVKSAISAAWSVISPVIDAIKAGFSALGDAARYVFDTVLVPMWHNFQLAASAAGVVLAPIAAGIKAGFTAIGDAATWLWNSAIVPAWEGIKAAVSGGWAAISPIFELIKNAFKSVSDFVSSVWSGLAGTVKSALDAVINSVKGPLRWIGGVLQKVPLKIGPIEIPAAQAAKDLGNTLAGLATGGVAGRTREGRLWGPGTGTSDSILGVNSRGYPTALVSAGEGVVKTDAMAKGGGPVVAALNSGWVPSPALLHAMIPGYRTGGVVDGPDVEAALSMAGTAYSQGNRTDCSGMVARVILKALGMDTGGGLMSTKNAEQWLTKLGFRTGTGGPGAITVGWYDRGPAPNDGHMAMTLSNGQNAEAGGGNDGFTIGGDAKGGDDPSFDQHMYLPIESLFPEGAAGSASGLSSAYSSSTGGYDAPDPAKVRDAEQKVADADQRIREADTKVREEEAAVRELAPDAKESTRIAAQRQLDAANATADTARREKQDAEDELAKVKQGTPSKGESASTRDGQGGEGQLGEVGSIASQFLKDTFGLGDLFPDPSQLGIVKLAQALLGIKYTPQGTGFRGGLLAGLPNAQALTDPNQGTLGLAPPGAAADAGPTGSGLPFGMIPGVSSVLPDVAAPAAAHQGTGQQPGPVDQSTNVTINNPQGTPEQNEQRIRRTLLKTPRYGTYTSNPGVMGT